MRTTFVTGADQKYFPMIMEWIHSIRRFPQSKNMDVCILDSGLSEEQKALLAPLVSKIIEPDWPCTIPERKIRGRDFLKSCVCRPFINKIFPGYDMYFWMDADTWVQDWAGIELFLQGGQTGRITVTSQADRAYPKGMRVKFLGMWPWKARSFYYSNGRKAFGYKLAQKLFPYHQLSAGAFCLHKDSPHWDRWQSLVQKVLKTPFGSAFTAEQLCLGVLIHLEGYEAEVLPSWTHWFCEHKPLWDSQNKRFVEPYLPHNPVGILHLSGFDQMRVDRTDTTDFKTLQGDKITMSYRYPDYNGEVCDEVSSAA